MVPSRVTFKLGLKKDAPEILKPIFTAREATIPNMLEELAYVPKIMQDTELKIESTTTIDGVGEGNECIETLLHGY